MLGLNSWNAHVAGERFSSDHYRYCLLEPKDREECLCAADVAHDDCQMVEVLHHLVPPVQRSALFCGIVSVRLPGLRMFRFLHQGTGQLYARLNPAAYFEPSRNCFLK